MSDILQPLYNLLTQTVSTLTAIRFEWPAMLLLLGFIPAFWIIYRNQQLKKIQQTALQYSQVALLQQLKSMPVWWKRLLWPIGLSILAILMVISLARPVVSTQVAVESVDMMLVMDISISMMATDIRPSRMEAAKLAAINFIKSLPKDVRIGLEWFAGSTYVLSPPTAQHDELIHYIRALKISDLKPRTELGTALQSALDVLQRERIKNKVLAPSPPQPKTDTSEAEDIEKELAEKEDSKQQPRQVIILLSDGDSHEGYPWQTAAEDALKSRVSVFTIGVGSQNGANIEYQGQVYPVSFDENTLKQIARTAQGEYFRIFKETDFKTVYDQVHDKTVHTETKEISLSFVMAGAQILLLTALVLLWLLIC